MDNFGHKMLTGCGKVLENFIRHRFGVKVRSVELNVNQRCSGMLASETDIEEAAMAGQKGVEAALAGRLERWWPLNAYRQSRTAWNAVWWM